MMYYTHLAFGLLVSLLYLQYFYITNKILFILVTLFFSILPDIDETKSKIGKKIKLVSKVINLIFGHRGILHTAYIPLAFFLFFYGINYEIAVAILLGYTSHLLADALTKYGIKPLSPIINIKIKGPIKTNSLLEKVFFLIVLFVDVYLLLLYIF